MVAPLALLGGLIGGLLGRFAREWFANKAVGIDFGSEFEGYDWVIGFASVGVLFRGGVGLRVGGDAQATADEARRQAEGC
jgi:hypothetical protein